MLLLLFQNMVVMTMKHNIELPIETPVYSTYNYQLASSAIFKENPTIRNWYLNEVMDLYCERDFLTGYTSPQIGILKTSWEQNPYLYSFKYPLKYIVDYSKTLIRTLLDNGFYVYFYNIDDYYIQGKTMFNERHFLHDGLICGYDMKKKTYSIFAYDKNWLPRKFESSQKCFDYSVRESIKNDTDCYICALKPKMDEVQFDCNKVLENITRYLDSSLRKYPKNELGRVMGTVTHDYILMYIDKLIAGDIPKERIDKRVFRVIWEHKNIMLERLQNVENILGIDSKSSKAYSKIVSSANDMRMMYAMYTINHKEDILPKIKNKLLYLKKREREILKDFIIKAERIMKNETME